MTNEELIAQAREVLTDFISFQNEKIASVKEEAKSTGLPDHPFNRDRITNEELILSLATTHLAEMDEHEAIEHCESPRCPGPVCSECGSKETLQVSYPCNELLTKSKLLLGVK